MKYIRFINFIKLNLDNIFLKVKFIVLIYLIIITMKELIIIHIYSIIKTGGGFFLTISDIQNTAYF